jgi:hypothetical protein
MAHFSSRLGRWVSRDRRVVVGPDPYDPTSPDYAQRHRSHATEMIGGMVRVDMGEPIK